jgi:hypothetical protein
MLRDLAEYPATILTSNAVFFGVLLVQAAFSAVSLRKDGGVVFRKTTAARKL